MESPPDQISGEFLRGFLRRRGEFDLGGREGGSGESGWLAGGGAGGRPPIPPRDSRAAGGDAGELAWPRLACRVGDWRAEREGRRGGTQRGARWEATRGRERMGSGERWITN